MKETAYLALALALALAVGGCAGQQQSGVLAAGQEVMEYAPPYTMAKMTQACAQPPSDVIAAGACLKLRMYAAACAGDIQSQAQLVNAGLAIAATLATATGQPGAAAGAAAGTAANNALVPLFSAAQLAACATGGFPVGTPAPAAGKS